MAADWNKVVFSGRMVAAPEPGRDMVRFRVAVHRHGREEADFLPCKAFRATARAIRENMPQGRRGLFQGHLQSGSYVDRDGHTRTTLDLVVDSVEFLELPRSAEMEEALRPDAGAQAAVPVDPAACGKEESR